MSKEYQHHTLNIVQDQCFHIDSSSLSRILTSPRNNTLILLQKNRKSTAKNIRKQGGMRKNIIRRIQLSKKNKTRSSQAFLVPSNVTLQELKYNHARDPHLIKYFINAEKLSTLYRTGKIIQDLQYFIENTNQNIFQCIAFPQILKLEQQLNFVYDKNSVFPKQRLAFQDPSLQAYGNINKKIDDKINRQTIIKASPLQDQYDYKMTINEKLQNSDRKKCQKNEMSFKEIHTSNFKINNKDMARIVKQNDYFRQKTLRIPLKSLRRSNIQAAQEKRFILKKPHIKQLIKNKQKTLFYVQNSHKNAEYESIFFKKLKSTANRIDKKINILKELGVKFNKP